MAGRHCIMLAVCNEFIWCVFYFVVTLIRRSETKTVVDLSTLPSIPPMLTLSLFSDSNHFTVTPRSVALSPIWISFLSLITAIQVTLGANYSPSKPLIYSEVKIYQKWPGRKSPRYFYSLVLFWIRNHKTIRLGFIWANSIYNMP